MKLNADAQAAYSVQDYSGTPMIEGVELVNLRRFNDDGGAMTELARLSTGEDGGAIDGLEGFVARQMNYSVVEPGAIKAFHLHKRQTDVWYVPPSDKMLLVLADCREGSPTEGQVRRMVRGDGNSRLVRIPPGVAHGCRNLRAAETSAIIYYVDVQFSVGDDCDEGRLAWDHFGETVWDVERG